MSVKDVVIRGTEENLKDQYYALNVDLLIGIKKELENELKGKNMGYIKSEEHFLNVLNKTLRESSIDRDKLLNKNAYLDLIYNANLTEKFTWELRTNPFLLEEENLLVWLQNNKCLGTMCFPSKLEHIITPEFHNEIKNLKGVSGVYSFWNKSDIPLYIGVSTDLQQRIISSFSERFSRYKKQIWFKHLITQNATNAAVLEIYFIGKFKPALNGISKYKDTLTIKIENEPSFCNRIFCNNIKEI